MKKLFCLILIGFTVLNACDNDEDTIDYALFDSTLQEAINTADVSREGESNGDIIIGSTDILNQVINQYTPYRETAVNQGTIDIATQRLRDAINIYESSIVIIDGTSLIETIDLAQQTHNNAEEGEFPGQYTVGSKAILQDAIDAAQTVADDPEAIQSVIDAALSDLLMALNAFNAGEVPPLDFTALEEAINNAQELHNNAEEGTEIGQYQVGSKAILQAAIDDADAIANTSEGITQTDVDEALATLTEAVNTFEEGIVGGPERDTTELEAKITEAQTIHDAAVEGTEPGQYSPGSKSILQTAIDDAQAVVDDLSLPQSDVDAAVVTLQTALDAFLDSINGVKVLSFGGSDYIETPNFQGIGGGAARTMEAWVNTSGNTNQTTLIMSWGINSPQQNWDMRINTGRLRIEFNGGGVNGNAASTIVNDGQWHHVAVVVPSSASSLNDAILYVDGVEQTTTGGSANPINSSTDNNFNIGRSASQTDRFFQGFISDVRIWDVERTQLEIINNKDARLSGNETGLIGYWKLNEGSGSTVFDSSSSGFDGTIIGVPTWETLTSGLPFDE